MRIRALSLAVLATLLCAPAVASPQDVQSTTDPASFFDQVHAPNWLGTDIPHTSIKRQRGGTCWSFSTVAMLESEALRTNDALAASLAASKTELDLSDYYPVYWAYVEKAREFARRKGENARFTDGGLSHDVTWLVSEYGIVPESDYAVVEDYGAMREELDAVLAARRQSGEWDEEAVVAEIRNVLDRHLAPPPATIMVDGREMTPVAYATEYLGLDPAAYLEITSYTDIPMYGRGELDVPDNWWDYDGYYNVPLDEFRRLTNAALDAGYPVVFDMDWGDPGASWNEAGLAVLPPDAAPGGPDQSVRQADLESGRTTDDHLVLAVDRRQVDGHDWYLIKNSHGTGSGRRGYVWVRGDYMALRVLAVMVHKDAIDPELALRMEAAG